MTIQQISIFLPNKPGSFRDIAKVLSENDINMRAMSVAETSDFGILRIIVDDNDKACDVLKNAGYIFKETPVIAVEVVDKPGALVQILDVLNDKEISLEYMYAFLSRKTDSAYMVIRVDEPNTAADYLKEVGVNVITKADIDKL
ncbi:MAG: ACT domain-containing protein [Firmicutes bacterium]|nr:ACT domain-containing protein [Bacillota bacterium]